MHTALMIGAYFIGATALLLTALVVIRTVQSFTDGFDEPFEDDEVK